MWALTQYFSSKCFNNTYLVFWKMVGCHLLKDDRSWRVMINERDKTLGSFSLNIEVTVFSAACRLVTSCWHGISVYGFMGRHLYWRRASVQSIILDVSNFIFSVSVAQYYDVIFRLFKGETFFPSQPTYFGGCWPDLQNHRGWDKEEGPEGHSEVQAGGN